MLQRFMLIEQEVEIRDLAFVAGDDFFFTVIFPFVVTGVTMIASIGDAVFTNAIQPDNMTVIFSIPKETTINLIDQTLWSLVLIQNSLRRTYVKGVYISL